MAGYTVVKLTDVEDKAVAFGLSPGLESRFAREPLELENSGLSLFRLAPGFRTPFGHRHATQEEVYVVVEGSLRAKLDDEVIELGEWDAIRVPPETVRCLEGGPEGGRFLAFGAPNTGMGDARPLPGWWSD